MKSTTFRAFIATAVCTTALTSYMIAGQHAGHGHHGHLSGPGFSSDDNPGLFGRMGKDEHNGFFNSDNNPGVQGSAFGRATAGSHNTQTTTSSFSNSG